MVYCGAPGTAGSGKLSFRALARVIAMKIVGVDDSVHPGQTESSAPTFSVQSAVLVALFCFPKYYIIETMCLLILYNKEPLNFCGNSGTNSGPNRLKVYNKVKGNEYNRKGVDFK